MRWRFIPDPDARPQCDHVWTMDFKAFGDGGDVHSAWRCERDAKFTNDTNYRCGYHTPGVGRKGSRRVPKD